MKSAMSALRNLPVITALSLFCMLSISCGGVVLKTVDLPEPVQVVADFQYETNYLGNFEEAFKKYTTKEYAEQNKEVAKISVNLVRQTVPGTGDAGASPLSKPKFLAKFVEMNEWDVRADSAEIYVKGTRDDKLPKCIYVKLIDGEWRIYKTTGSQVTISW